MAPSGKGELRLYHPLPVKGGAPWRIGRSCSAKPTKNKVDHGFNVTDVPMEFCLLYGEVGEAYQAWSRQKPDVGEELADVAIYLLGLAEIPGC